MALDPTSEKSPKNRTLSNDTFHYWRKILRKIIPSSLIEQVEDKEGDLMIVQEILTSFKLLVDSLEQPINRPSDNEEQKKFFSGILNSIL
jgi:hypothetical protein